jgi:hypothetical protein
LKGKKQFKKSDLSHNLSASGLPVNFLQNHLDDVFRSVAGHHLHCYCVGLILLSRLAQVGDALEGIKESTCFV